MTLIQRLRPDWRLSEKGPREAEGLELRFSHRLAAFHLAALAILLTVVLACALWISRAHNDLARESAARMVHGGVAALRERSETVILDYSIWDEAYAAMAADDRDWLHRNIGTGASDIGALDLIVLVDEARGREIAWTEGSPPEGTASPMPPEVRAAVLALLDDSPPEQMGARSAFARFGGDVWSVAVTRVLPLEGPPMGVPDEALPRQIHGLRVDEEMLEEIGRTLDGAELAVVDAAPPGASVEPLPSPTGDAAAYLAWTPPRPGATILRGIALPLGAALAIAAALGLITSRHAVRSARRLERALVDAQAADRSKTEFLSNVSHELRTPMNGVLGVAQLLESTPLDAEQRELLDVLLVSARQQMTLISDLLDFTQIESGSRRLVEEPFLPAEAAREAAGIVAPAARQKGLAMEVRLGAADGLRLVGDERAFKQILLNLVGNAVKFTDRGLVSISAEVERTGGAARCVFRVTDTGLGVAPSDQARIFGRFAQADSSIRRRFGGSGLGLTISQSLAEMMGGRIELESALGAGSTFTFRLEAPLAAEPAPVAEAA